MDQIENMVHQQFQLMYHVIDYLQQHLLFQKNLFGLNKNTKTFKPGQKLPSSSYKLDKDDANSLKELEQYNKSIH